MADQDLLDRVRSVLRGRRLAGPESPVLLMVSGGSDSTALAYLGHDLQESGDIGMTAMLHVNHQLRGQDADDDELFVSQLAELLGIPLFTCEIDIAGEAARTGENVEAVARRERYLAANEALESLCRHASAPFSYGRIFTAHTADDRVENFYMRSIVGTGPGGFRSMKYENGPVVRPLLDLCRDELRDYLRQRAETGAPVVRDASGALWREDATNAHTDRFRAYVRQEIVPLAKARNPQLLEVLCRSMNLIADEDDMLESMTDELVESLVSWIDQPEGCSPDVSAGCVLSPKLGESPVPLERRVVLRVLRGMLGPGARIETASVDAVLDAWDRGGENAAAAGAAAGAAEVPPRIRSGYVTNIQGDLAVSANKRGVRIEPMAAYRARRKKL